VFGGEGVDFLTLATVLLTHNKLFSLTLAVCMFTSLFVL